MNEILRYLEAALVAIGAGTLAWVADNMLSWALTPHKEKLDG